MQLALLSDACPRIEPRDYQLAAVKSVFDNWKARPSSAQLIIAPCGAGKTVMIGMAAQEYLATRHARVLSLCHVSELIDQSYVTFREMFPAVSAGIYAAKLGRKDRRAKVTFAMVQSVVRNIGAFADCGLVIVDEAHTIPHADDGMYKEIFRALREARGDDQLHVLGLTGTPYRLNSGNLLEPYKDNEPLFDEIAYEIDIMDLLEQGHLCPVVSRGTKTRMDTTGIHKRGGEFIDSELNAKFNTDAINRSIAKEIATAGVEQDRKSWAVFCITVDHATRMRDLIRSHGVSCEMVCGETPTAERRRIIEAFKQFKIRCVTSINVLGTGFNHPAIDLVALCRPTNSPGVYVQQSGRAMRTYPGKKDALLLDFSGSVMRHGLLTNVKGVFKKRKAEEEDEGPKARECPECGTLNEPGSKVCVGCQYEWPIIERGNAEEKLSKQNLADRVMDDAVWAPVLASTFRHSEPQGRPATLQLLYQVPINGKTLQASEIFCLDHEHHSWAAKKARADWTKRTGLAPPASVLDAVRRIEELRPPRFVRVVQSDCGRYWNVKGIRY